MITQAFESICARGGANPALVSGKTSWSYDDVLRWSRSRARLFAEQMGWRAGGCVVLQLPNGPEFPVAVLALARLGIATLPVNTRWTSSEIRDALSSLPISGVITTYANRAQWAAALPAVRPVLVDDLPACPSASADPGLSDRPRWVAHTGLCLLTSGTTDRPKIVMRSQSSLMANASNVGETLALAPGKRVLSVAPFFHGNGFSNGMLSPLLHGATVVLMATFSPARLFESLRADAIDLVVASPFVYGSLLDVDAEPGSLSHVGTAITSGAPMPSDTRRRCEEHLGLTIRQLYGSSEAGTIAIEAAAGESRGSVGRPLRTVEIRVLDESGAVQAPGQPGRITVRSPAVMDGYWTDAGLDSARVADGFYDMGDVGFVSGDGNLVLTGRTRPFINAGGNKISIEEIERVLNRIPQVVGSRVRGVAHERQTEIIEARLTVRANSTLTRAEVVAHCREHLAEHKIPRIVTFATRHDGDLPVKTP